MFEVICCGGRKNSGVNYIALQSWRRMNAVGMWSLGLVLAYCIFRQLRFIHLRVVSMIRDGMRTRRIEDVFPLNLLHSKAGHVDIKIDQRSIGTKTLWTILDVTYWGDKFTGLSHNGQMAMMKVSDGGINLGKDLTLGCITSNLHNMWYSLFVKFGVESGSV